MMKKCCHNLSSISTKNPELPASVSPIMANPDVAVPGVVWWLILFLARGFYLTCEFHRNIFGNHENQFCIDCKTNACKHCLDDGFHDDHKVIKIYRHIFKDVVKLDDINTHLDCSGIESYMFKGRLVIPVYPLPYHKPSGWIRAHISCLTCARKLTDSKENRFCSIACKYDRKH